MYLRDNWVQTAGLLSLRIAGLLTSFLFNHLEE